MSVTDRLETLIQHGADVSISGPRGTPLQMALKILLYCDFRIISPRDWVQDTLTTLRNNGANCIWREPDGSMVDEAQINALCEMTDEQLTARNRPIYKLPDWYTWETLTAEERLRAELSLCQYRAEHGLEAFAPDQPLSRSSKKATPESYTE